MITGTKGTLLLTATCAVVFGGLAACNKTPSQGGPAPQGSPVAATPATPTGKLAAGLQEPSLPDPERRDPEAIAMQDKYVQWVKEKAMPAGVKKPSFPDPNRSDRAAVMQRYKYGLWNVAETIAANDLAQKQMEQFYSRHQAPKGNYGKMAEGLPSLPSDKK